MFMQFLAILSELSFQVDPIWETLLVLVITCLRGKFDVSLPILLFWL